MVTGRPKKWGGAYVKMENIGAGRSNRGFGADSAGLEGLLIDAAKRFGSDVQPAVGLQGDGIESAGLKWAPDAFALCNANPHGCAVLGVVGKPPEVLPEFLLEGADRVIGLAVRDRRLTRRVDRKAFRGRLRVPVQSAEQRHAVAAQRVVLGDEPPVEFDDHRVEVNHFPLDREMLRRQGRTIGGIFDEYDRSAECAGDELLISDDDVRHASLGRKPADDRAQLRRALLLALELGLDRPARPIMYDEQRNAVEG